MKHGKLHHSAPEHSPESPAETKPRAYQSEPRPNRTEMTAVVRPNLDVDAYNDPREREADAIADALVQRKEACTCGGTCAACKAEEALNIQRKARDAHRAAQVPASPGIMSRLGSGRSLDPTTRRFFESNLNQDLSSTRIHTDAAAAESAAALNARAYTLGDDIVFASGEYAPQTNEGKKLLAHELAHSLQQRGGDPVVQRKDETSKPAFPAKGIKVIGSDANDLLVILMQCTGLALSLDDKQMLVRAEGAREPKGSTAAAADELDRLLSLNVGVIIDTEPTNLGVGVGAFSHEHPGMQSIDVANIKVLASASGAAGGFEACSAVLHEISEAFTGRSVSLSGAATGEELFKKAHEQGTNVENAIRKELGLPLRDVGAGDMIMLGVESGLDKSGAPTIGTKFLFLESAVFGSGGKQRTQLTLIRLVVTSIKGGNVEGDHNKIASHVVTGAVTFSTREEAVKVFNKHAAKFGFTPLPESSPP